jgi:hypothetical protein
MGRIYVPFLRDLPTEQGVELRRVWEDAWHHIVRQVNDILADRGIATIPNDHTPRCRTAEVAFARLVDVEGRVQLSEHLNWSPSRPAELGLHHLQFLPLLLLDLARLPEADICRDIVEPIRAFQQAVRATFEDAGFALPTAPRTMPNAPRVVKERPLRVMGWSPPAGMFRGTGKQEALLRLLADGHHRASADLLRSLYDGVDENKAEALRKLVGRLNDKLKANGAPCEIVPDGLAYTIKARGRRRSARKRVR